VLPGDRVHGRVARIEDYGVFVALPHGREGLVHVSNLAWERVECPADLVRVGDTLEARVLYVKAGGKRIGLGVKQLSESPWKALARELGPGALVEGVVTRLTEYGAFVRVRDGVEGLLHNSESGDDGRRARGVLQRGQRLSVRVVAIEPEDERLSLSLLHTSGARIAPEEASARLDLAQLARDVVAEPPGTNLGRLLRRALDERRKDAS
jgi:small subunit ribosomal protein S1